MPRAADMQTVQVGKKTYSVGLWWQTLEQRKSLAKEARVLARSVNKVGSNKYDCFALRRQVSVFQAGFGDGFKKSALSLAATLADGQSGSWLARFEFSTGTWIVAVVDDTILPNGDFFGPSGEADIIQRDLEQMGGWDRIINPGSIEDSATMLEQMVRQGGRKYRMIPVKPSVPWIPIVLGALVLVGGGVGHQMHVREVARRQAEERAAKMAAFQRELAASQAGIADSDTQPWQQAAAPESVVAACREQMSAYPLFELGWALKGWICDGKTIVADWQRTSQGSFESLPQGGTLDLKQPELLKTVKELSSLSERGVQALNGAQESIARIYEIGRLLGGNVAIQWASPPPPVPGEEAAPPPPMFEKHGWSLEALPSLAEQLGPALDGVSGLVIQSVVWDPSSGWSLKGDVYVR